MAENDYLSYGFAGLPARTTRAGMTDSDMDSTLMAILPQLMAILPQKWDLINSLLDMNFCRFASFCRSLGCFASFHTGSLDQRALVGLLNFLMQINLIIQECLDIRSPRASKTDWISFSRKRL